MIVVSQLMRGEFFTHIRQPYVQWLKMVDPRATYVANPNLQLLVLCDLIHRDVIARSEPSC